MALKPYIAYPARSTWASKKRRGKTPFASISQRRYKQAERRGWFAELAKKIKLAKKSGGGKAPIMV